MPQRFSILVTGGAGYLGSILVPELLAAGHRVTVLDTFMYGQNSLAHLCANQDFDVFNGDARAPDTLSRLVRDADVVIPLAALVGAPLCNKDPIAATTTNRDAITTLYGGDAAPARLAVRSRQGRGGADRARPRQFDQPAPCHRVRHVATHAHRPAGQ
jgi:nucleoside-diphosphate-sugar epimerase